MPLQTLVLDLRPPLAIVTLNRPERNNRIDRQMIEELRSVVTDFGDEGLIRAVIITGTDAVFSAGWDSELLLDVRLLPQRRDASLATGFQFLADAPLPVIAAVNGEALSAGFELALACDLRVAASTARFGFPETIDDRLPMAGGTQRLARIAGRAMALELILTGESIDAPTAFGRGIVTVVTAGDTLLDEAIRLASLIASRGPIAVRLGKEAIHQGLDMPLEQALRYETDLTVLLQTTHDRAEGVQAFVEKRSPRFEGR
ncbi:MAG: enoyl-CoA hydratase/isomerase family protein [Dehalococcoidia bacterium]